jgi:hypothetical protein
VTDDDGIEHHTDDFAALNPLIESPLLFYLKLLECGRELLLFRVS